MRDNLHDNKRVAKNTLYLYLRTLVVMAVTIYTSRVVLDVLGVDDYGIYNVVGGFVSMFTVLSGTLTAASQRFIAYELGCKKPDITKVFSTAVTIHIVLAAIIFILLESIGIWFLNSKMNITSDRLYAANWVFQCSVITFCISLISIPYNAAIVAYEKMSAFAYISIFEVACKLACVFSLYYISSDSLIVYAIFMMLVAILLRVIYGCYCNMHFEKCRYIFSFDKPTFSKMLGFCGWNFIGSSAAVLNGQGINILFNLFFGVTLNAARGIASQVESSINTFVQNFMMALNPQITKSYASGDYEYVNSIILTGTKLAFFLLWILALPVCLNTEYILQIWLKKVPDYAACFIQLGLVYGLLQNLSQCLYTTMLATGNIKKYQIVVGGLSILAFPATYLFFWLGFPVEWGYYSMIMFSVICLLARLYLMREMVPSFSPKRFYGCVIKPITICVIPILLVTLPIHCYIENVNGVSFISESVISVLVSLFFIWLFGLTKTERNKIQGFIHKNINKYKNKNGNE